MSRTPSKPMKDIRGYLTEKEISKIFSKCPNKKFELILRIMYMCGRRVSEVVGRSGFKKRDILFNEKKIVFKILKKKEEEYRRIPLDSKTLEMLREHTESMKHNQIVFPVSRQYIGQELTRTGKRAGITKVGTGNLHPHHLRHSFAVNWIKRGGDFTRLNKILAHSDLSTTQFYLQFSPEDVADEYERIME